jgi:hypothetical protein
MIELFFLLALVFLIAVAFYRQRQPDLTILQVEQDQVQTQFPDLLEERQPIVIRGVPQPRGITQEALQRTTRLAEFPVAGHPLSSILESPAALAPAAGTPTLSQEERATLATELSLPVWAKHTWLPLFESYSWLAPWIGTMKAEVLLGGLGMHRTTALYTCIVPTQGKYQVSLLAKSSEAFLPPTWEYRYPGSLTVNDTPLVADLKYLDVIVAPGNALCVPAHMIVSIEPQNPTEFAAAALLEYHEPISALAKILSG